MKTQEISKWKGIWKDDKGRFVHIEPFETPENLAIGFFIIPIGAGFGVGVSREFYRDGNHTLDGSKLMERKIGEEKGWPL